MLLMEMGFLPQLLSAAPAHDSASVITPPFLRQHHQARANDAAHGNWFLPQLLSAAPAPK
jgi:hypothetical protein